MRNVSSGYVRLCPKTTHLTYTFELHKRIHKRGIKLQSRPLNNPLLEKVLKTNMQLHVLSLAADYIY